MVCIRDPPETVRDRISVRESGTIVPLLGRAGPAPGAPPSSADKSSPGPPPSLSSPPFGCTPPPLPLWPSSLSGVPMTREVRRGPTTTTSDGGKGPFRAQGVVDRRVPHVGGRSASPGPVSFGGQATVAWRCGPWAGPPGGVVCVCGGGAPAAPPKPRLCRGVRWLSQCSAAATADVASTSPAGADGTAGGGGKAAREQRTRRAPPFNPRKELWAMARVHKRRSAQKCRQKKGPSVAYKTRGAVLCHRGVRHEDASGQATNKGSGGDVQQQHDAQKLRHSPVSGLLQCYPPPPPVPTDGPPERATPPPLTPGRDGHPMTPPISPGG